jgi:hypothetical protein
MAVVMLNEDAKHLLEVWGAADQDPIQAVATENTVRVASIEVTGVLR